MKERGGREGEREGGGGREGGKEEGKEGGRDYRCNNKGSTGTVNLLRPTNSLSN